MLESACSIEALSTCTRAGYPALVILALGTAMQVNHQSSELRGGALALEMVTLEFISPFLLVTGVQAGAARVMGW